MLVCGDGLIGKRCLVCWVFTCADTDDGRKYIELAENLLNGAKLYDMMQMKQFDSAENLPQTDCRRL